MQVVKARLKCGCRGDERLDWQFVEVRFITHEPCQAHEEWLWRWRSVPSIDLVWRDEKQVERYAHENALFEEWERAGKAAVSAGQQPESLRAFILRRYAEHPEWMDDDE
jgi:hypothetical protein